MPMKNVASSGVSASMPHASIQIFDTNTDSSMSSSPLVYYLLVTAAGVRPTMSTL